MTTFMRRCMSCRTSFTLLFTEVGPFVIIADDVVGAKSDDDEEDPKMEVDKR